MTEYNSEINTKLMKSFENDCIITLKLDNFVQYRLLT